MASYERRAAGPQGERDQHRFDRYGRSMSLGQWESERSTEDRYGRGYEGDCLAISDFFRRGRDRYARTPAVADKMEPYRIYRNRAQSIACPPKHRFSDDRPSYQGRLGNGPERQPREFMGRRHGRDYPGDRIVASYYDRGYVDDYGFTPLEKFAYNRPGFDRYGYERYSIMRPIGDGIYDDRFFDRYAHEGRMPVGGNDSFRNVETL